jgi:3-mercaptopyruvate sulfurtransferase SseA
MRNQNRITPAQARQLMQQRGILWDVRTPAEYAAGHIPSARNVPLDRLEEELPNVQRPPGHCLLPQRAAQRHSGGAAGPGGAAGVRPWLYQLLGWPADTVIRRSP